MQIINGHPCYLHHPKCPNRRHQMVRLLRAIHLFSGHTKKEIQKLGALIFCTSACRHGVYFPSYTFTELSRNGYISKFWFKNIKTKRPSCFYDITYKGLAFLKRADENDLKWIEDVHKSH